MGEEEGEREWERRGLFSLFSRPREEGFPLFNR